MNAKIKQAILKILKLNNRYLKFLYRYDMHQFEQYSCMNKANPEAIATELRLLAHTIEKALSLPNCRPGFGKEKIKRILYLYNQYANLPQKQDDQVLQLVASTIKSYVKFQQEHQIDVSFIPEAITNEQVSNKIKAGVQIINRENRTTNFAEIAHSRHSLRYYSSQEIKKDDVIKAISIAQTAPCACNRQATHVFACLDKEKIEEILKLHGGIRGFGMPTVIFAITGDLGLYQNEYERNLVFVDGGIFCMNLLYALDSCGIATCPAIWGGEPSDDAKLKELLSIPDSHKIVILIIGGYFPGSKYKVAQSPKRDVMSILHII